MTGLLRLASLFTIALLAGCGTSAEKAPVSDPDSALVPVVSAPTADLDSRCNADSVQDLIGKPISDELAVEARDDAEARYLRITRPNQPVSMDYNAQRLNIDTDDNGVIKQLSCG
ncbi:hypothetical protein IB229_18335 [Pseudomonas sp. PDM14]|uniref:I78 family peptidase inhibitor n=1 Tax=Pseudomonas sp. PDM14 TaxID=2769288 RepID=UPI0017825C4B|nr:I78 family peptidase inhibitor [Pseudomonas sp. PDM14]MBD9484946.1 hypothetical protein [Pseudomonas sp. PDM14]